MTKTIISANAMKLLAIKGHKQPLNNPTTGAGAPSPNTDAHATTSRSLLNKLKQALSRPKPTPRTATTDLPSHNGQEHNDTTVQDTTDSFSWFRMDVAPTVQTPTHPTPRAERADSITTIVTTPEGGVSWVSPLAEDGSYEQWVEEERRKAAMKRKSMVDLNHVGNGMTVFNARPASSLVPLYQASVDGEDLQGRRAAAVTDEYATQVHAITTAYSIKGDALTFPATNLLDYDQESIRPSPAKPTPRASPEMVASQVNIMLRSSLNRMHDIQDSETVRRRLSNTISRHIYGVNRSAHLGDEQFSEGRDTAIADAEAGLTAGPSGGFDLDDTIGGVPRWFAENIAALTEPSPPVGHFSVLCDPHETTTGDDSEIRIHPTPEVVFQSTTPKHCSTAGVIGDSNVSLRVKPLGWITTEEMVPVLVPKPVPRPRTFLGRVWKRVFDGLMKFSESVIVVPTLQWDFQDEKWAHVRGGRYEIKM